MELKDVIHNYLPYELKCETKLGILELTVIELNNKYPLWFTIYGSFSKNKKQYNYEILSKNNCKGYGFKYKKCKPILLPLSKITKEIADEFYIYDDKYDSFEVSSNKIKYKYNDRNGWRECSIDSDYRNLSIAFKNHLDLFGLIQSNQAIDKTNLK